MRTLLAIILALTCGLLGSGLAADQPLSLPALPGQGTGVDAMPPAEIRVIRDEQAKVYGAPTLPMDAAKPDALLALSDLGSMAASSGPGAAKLQQEDYDALFALLQRYRDDLLKMGMDGAELQAQMEGLQSRTTELELRLKNLLPKDGLKITGRFYSVFDDLHITGPGRLLNTAFLGASQEPDGSGAPNAKTLTSGVRSQMGVAHVGLLLDGTRGPVSGHVQMDFLTMWGFDQASVNLRQVWVEWRLPVVLQVGDLNADFSPLTLWRNDQYQPFEPLIFQDRRKRMEDDVLLAKDQWPLTGVRASTDLLLFGSNLLHVQSITGIAAYGQNSSSPSNNLVVYTEPNPYPTGAAAVTATADYSGSTNFLSIGNTYFEGWRLDMDLGSSGAWSVGYNGMLFWNDLTTSPANGIFQTMSELVDSLELKYKSGGFNGGLEAAIGRYQPSCLTVSAVAPMTGTAMTADAAWSGDQGHIRAYGRYVSSGFHAAGAQGRTVDYNYQVAGPFLTENSQIGTSGLVGLFPGQPGIATSVIVPESYASRLNNRLIPPGLVTKVPGLGTWVFNPWRNLIGYGPGEESDAYGAATPNRVGGGLEAAWKFFKGGLAPMASADFMNEIDPVSSTTGTMLPAFSMTRYRGGLTVDLEPWFGWPVRFGGGMTLTNSSDGATDLSGNKYALTTSQTDASLDWRPGKPWGASLGYRKMVANGEDETFVYTAGMDQVWDIMGAGFWWRPQDQMSLDLNYTQAHTTPPGQAASSLQLDQIVARLTMEF
jgi:hypothetical protein